MNDDSISRQAAIDTLAIDEKLLKRVLDNADIVGNEREKYEWGLGLIEAHIADIKDLSSVQPWKICVANITLSEDQVREAVEKAKGGILHNMPTVIEPERKTGRWKVTPVYIKCSECGESFMLMPQNFCPNCGADMRGEENE